MEDEISDEPQINFLEGIIIDDLSAWMDGGSVTLHCTIKDERKIIIEVVQHVSLGKNEWTKIPGSLYLNNVLVSIRSPLERKIVKALKNATFSSDYKTNSFKLDKRIIQEKIDFIESDNFIEIARKMGRIIE